MIKKLSNKLNYLIHDIKNNKNIYFAFTLIFLWGILGEETILIIEFIGILYLLFFKEVKIDKTMINFFFYILFIFIYSLFTMMLFGNNLILIVKQIIGITISFYFAYLLIGKEKIEKIFSIYLTFCILLSVLCFIQEFGYLIKFKPLYNYGFNLISPTLGGRILRASGPFPEPSWVAYFLSPAIGLFIIQHDKKPLKKMIIIFLGAILSFSSLAILAVMLSLVIKVIKFKTLRSKIVSTLLVIALFLIIYNINADFQLRVKDTFDVLFIGKDLSNANLSTFVLRVNMGVAFENFNNTFFLGSGIGSHQIAYSKYSDLYTIGGPQAFINMSLNSQDANSMALRLISELGIVGIISTIVLFTKTYTSQKKYNKYYWALFIYFALILLRQGHYFTEGFYFFIVMFLVNKKQANEEVCKIRKEQTYDYKESIKNY